MGSVTRNTRLAMPYHVQELLFMQRGGYSKSTDTVRWGTIPTRPLFQATLHEAISPHPRYLCFCFNVARCQTDATNTEQEMS